MPQRVRVLLSALLVVLLPGTAVAQDSADEARQQAEQFEQQADDARARADELAAETDQVRVRVEAIAASVAQTEQRLADARAEADRVEQELTVAGAALDDAELRADKAATRADRARARAERAERDLAATRDELRVNEDQRASVVRNAYMYGPGVASPTMAALEVAGGSDPTEVADVVHMLDVVLVDHGLLVDESVRLTDQAQRLSVAADAARREREAQAAEAADARDEAATRHAEVLVLMGQAEAAVAAEQDAITALDTQQRRAQRQVRRLEAARQEAVDRADRRTAQAREASERAEELAAEAEAAAAAAAAAARAATPPAPAGVTVTGLSGGLARVGGITVAASIAPQVEALLEAARADGLVLGGYGYRSIETTIRLRRANGCPDVWSSPSWACRVPTARPGTSMHERGLAIDFTWHGRTICYPYPPSRCHGNAAHDWLRANASRFGLYGLSTEAWHFSTNGR